ncbi:MAG: sterol desaturase family protein [bacterium]|nr:sterol desaturase family protein [bacterium]
MSELIEIIKNAYVGYANYLWREITNPSWHNYFYWLIGVSAAVWLLEIVRPWRRNQSIIRQDFWIDAWYMFFNFFVFSLIGYAAVSNVVVFLVRSGAANLLGIREFDIIDVRGLPWWSQMLLLFVLRDFIQWNIHRLLHANPTLWNFHKVHHSVEQMGFAAHLRFHWMETVVYRVLEYLPLALIGFGLKDFFAVHIVSLTIGHLNHANIVLPIGPLKYIFNSPQMHIWHHAKELPAGVKGVNYGLSLSIWDYIFGTVHVPVDGRDITLGFENVEHYPKTFMRQLVEPFRNIFLVLIVAILFVACERPSLDRTQQTNNTTQTDWTAFDKKSAMNSGAFVPPDTSTIPKDKTGGMIRYGRELLVNFPYYLGPNGKVGKYSRNGLGCQSCHLEAGTRPYGLSYFSAHARYPQYRAREGRILTLADRVNNCVERPLNGRPLPLDSKEMIAIVTYIKWLGAGVPVNGNVPGDKLKEIALLDRPADPHKGKTIYKIHCVRCHGDDGQGKLRPDGISYEYPPLWGKLSYQPGSSMHRVIKAAQFIKYNMPFDSARWNNPVLTDEEAMDVAAFVNDDNQHVRPFQVLVEDYPAGEEKPVDYWKGPYSDPFSNEAHKFGPFKPIMEWRKKNGQPTGY